MISLPSRYSTTVLEIVNNVKLQVSGFKETILALREAITPVTPE